MNSIIDLLKQSLIGKKLKHTNQYSREVILEVENVKIEKHSRQITPDTAENDWWGESYDWQTIDVYFIDGSKKEFNMNSKFDIV